MQPSTLHSQTLRSRWVWLTLGLPPILFLVIIIGTSLYAYTLTPDPTLIAQQVSHWVPQQLVIVQLVLLGWIGFVARANRLGLPDLGWALAVGQSLWRELLLGSLVGLTLGLLYPWVLSPVLVAAQKTFGDYVPAGELLTSLGTSLIPFFIANVLCAPLIEETLYRGFALTQLQKHYGRPLALLIGCLGFGLLHWAGGFWYILLTGGVVGGLFGGLFFWRRNLLAAFAAHFVLNLIEFLFIVLLR